MTISSASLPVCNPSEETNLPVVNSLLSQLDNLNHSITRTLQILQDFRGLEQRPASNEDIQAADDVDLSIQSCLKLVKFARGNIQNLDTQLKHFEDNGTIYTRSQRLKDENDKCLISAKENIDLARIKVNEKSTQSKPDNGELWPWPLEREEYQRYGRQLIMPEIGLQEPPTTGQLRLKKSSVLIVGVGGLGCPAATYLAGAGVGTLGLMDGDTVEISNLHRQILHSTEKVGCMKVESAIHSLYALNPLVKYKAHNEHLTPQNALQIFAQYDLILDCTDHPTSRYLISDAAVLLNKPIVSASALKVDGQLTTLNNPPAPPADVEGGPCYRCIFPKPPPPESVVSCSEGGILGPVVGVMGVLQALEAIKVITAQGSSQGDSLDQKDTMTASHASTNQTTPPASLLIFSMSSPQPFRSVRLRGRRAGCPACSAEASITRESFTSGSLDYIQFCGIVRAVDILPSEERITASAYAIERRQAQALNSACENLLVDVREQLEFELCSLSGSVNIPYSEISNWKSAEDAVLFQEKMDGKRSVRFICRRGNDSQLAVTKIKELGLRTKNENEDYMLAHIDEGLKAWKRDVDEDWPAY